MNRACTHLLLPAAAVRPVSAALPRLLGLAGGGQPAKLQEAVADCLCALASHDSAKQQLCAAGEARGSCLLGCVYRCSCVFVLLRVGRLNCCTHAAGISRLGQTTAARSS
jgi:hypothetical protein